MEALIEKSRIWDRETPADGELFETEYLGIYSNLDNFYNFALAQLGMQKGLIQGRLKSINSTPTVLTAVKNNVYEVDGNIIRLTGNLSLDFSSLTNIFRNDGITPISATSETQNKQLYVLLTTNGSLHAMIIPDSEIEGSSHLYANNPELLKDFYATTPGIFDSAKNGYYKNSKRIVGHVRLNGSNQIEFTYELGIGHRYMDVQSMPIGGKFTEVRWKREHPACYYPDGSNISGMATEAPELHRILGSTTLPDWKDRFGRNIDFASGRSLRDLEEDAFQSFFLATADRAQDSSSSAPFNYLCATNSLNSSNGSVEISFVSDGINGTPRSANETRPKNYSESVQIVRG